MADRETLLALNAQLMSKLTAGTATDDDLQTLTAVMGLLERSVLVRSPSFCARMADRETLLAINAQLVSKLTDGTATDDDFKTLEVVMGLLEKDAATGSISSSVPQTVTIGRWGSPAGASAAAASVQIIGKRKDRGRTEVLVKQSGGGESQWQPIKSVSAVRIASQLEWIPSGSEGQKWYNKCEIEDMRAEADDEDWGGYSDNPRIAEQLRTKQSHTKQRASMDQEAAKRIVSADPALEARKNAAAAERLAAAERAMAAREKDHTSTLQRQREEERRREEEAIRRAEDRRRQDEERQRVEEERRRKEAQRRADWQADSYRRDYRRDKYNWREDYHQPQPHIPGGFAKGDTVASRVSSNYAWNGDQIKVGDIGMVLGACTADKPDKHSRVSVDFGGYGIWDMLVWPDSEAQIYKVPDSLPQGMPGQGMAQGGGPKPPQQQGYPPPQGFSPQQQGYRPQQQGYPPPQGYLLQQGYPPQQQGYPLQQGYPPQQRGMPFQVHSPQQQRMPPQQGYPPQLSQAQAELGAAEDAAPAKTMKPKSARLAAALKKAAAEERKKQPAPKAAMETLQGAVGGAAAAATTTAIGIGGAMMTGATIGEAVGMIGGPVGMAIGAVVGVALGAAIGGSGLLSADDMPTNVSKAPSSPTEEATENLANASLIHTARTDRSDFLDELKEAEAKDEAKAKTKAEKAATFAAKKAGKEAAAAKKKTPWRLGVSAVSACSKQSSAAP